jgi:peptidoglycan/xylan/chitin deacetylase (PgdA/CDA1 family)
MSLRSTLGVMRRQMLSSLYRREVPFENREPIVSFTFDDFPRSAYLAGGSILEHFGARGTFYTAYGLMNTCNELGDHFRADDLDSLLDRGHELASHTYSHLSARSASYAAFCQDAEKGRQAVERMTGTDASNFAYPFGHVTLRAKPALGLTFASVRGIFPGLNGPEADLNLLRANSLYGDLDGAGRVETLIAENCRRKSWLIFYTHDVRPDPSPYGCTLALLEAAVGCAVQSGCRIRTVREAMLEAKIQPGSPDPHARQYVSS